MRMMVTREGWIIFGVVCGVLVVASLIGFILRRRYREGPGKSVVENLNSRIKAWWVMVFLLSGSLMFGPKPVIVLFAFVSFAALREFITVTPTRKADHSAIFLGFFVVLPAQYFLVWTNWYGLFTILIPVYVFLMLPALTVVSSDTKNFLTRTAEAQWGVMICIYCISHVPALLMLRIPHCDLALLLVFLVLVVQASDVLQYIWGKLFGRHKIAPIVSPSKTVEGFVGGVLSATALGAGLWWLTPFKIWQAAAMSLLITIMGFLGGLVMSAIKRDRGVKDWGNLIEGHGGMLDRIDSVCFAAPIFFHLTRYFFSVE
jgi:phosphatidate cytidylyltransferase